MLNSQEMAKRLIAAMDNRNPPLLSVDLAHHCKVTPQAVHGWRKNGRIAKRHLTTIAQLTGYPLEFFLEDSRGESRTTKAVWQRISAALAVAVAMLLPPYAIDKAQSKPLAASVYYVKSALRRWLKALIPSYLRGRSGAFARSADAL